MQDKLIVRTTASLFNNWSVCPTKGYYTDTLQIGLAEGSTSPAMDVGTVIHAGLEVYYMMRKFGYNHDIARTQGVLHMRRVAVDLPSLDAENTDTAIRTYSDYLAYWGPDDFDVIEVEKPFSKIFYEDNQLVILLEGKKDLKAYWQKIKYVIDHKSEGRKTQKSQMSNQFMAYAWEEGSNQVILNQIGTQKTVAASERFKRHIMSYTESQIKEWYSNTVDAMMDYIRQGVSGKYRMNLTGCKSATGSLCQFHTICSADVPDRERVIFEKYVHREPHDPHEVD